MCLGTRLGVQEKEPPRIIYYSLSSYRQGLLHMNTLPVIKTIQMNLKTVLCLF